MHGRFCLSVEGIALEGDPSIMLHPWHSASEGPARIAHYQPAFVASAIPG
jgi:hypothetical protein